VRGLIGPSFVAGAPSREGIALTPASNTEAIRGVPIAVLPRRVPRLWNCRPSALEVILRRPQEPPPPKPLSPRVRAASTVLRARSVLAPSTPLIASVFGAGVSAMPSRDGAPATKEGPIKPRTIRHHRLWLEGAPNQAFVSPPLPLLHHADLGYQVCGNGTRVILSHGTTMR